MWWIERSQSYVITESKDNCKPELIKLLLNNNFSIYWSVLHRLNHYKYLNLKSTLSQGWTGCILPAFPMCMMLRLFSNFLYFLKKIEGYILSTNEKFARCKKYIPRFVCLCIFSQCLHVHTQDLISSNSARYTMKPWTCIPCARLSCVRNLCWMQ